MVTFLLRRDESGYVALLSVLIIGAAALAIGVVLLLTSTDSQRNTLTSQQSKQARSLAIACGQEALVVIHDNTGYTGTGNLTLGQGSCSYTVTSTGATTRTIDVTANVSNITRKAQIYVTIGALNISISSWKEIN